MQSMMCEGPDWKLLREEIQLVLLPFQFLPQPQTNFPFYDEQWQDDTASVIPQSDLRQRDCKLRLADNKLWHSVNCHLAHKYFRYLYLNRLSSEMYRRVDKAPQLVENTALRLSLP